MSTEQHTTEESNLVAYARRELTRQGWLNFDDDGGMYDGMLGEAVLELMRTFAAQGHTGMSAPMVTNLFDRLARFEPLSPLTGEPDEWTEVGPGAWQNNRCSHVFRDADRFGGQPYDIQAVVFEDPDGDRYTSADSHRVIEFPYTPPQTPEIVRREFTGDA
jgi:hypothetical protein